MQIFLHQRENNNYLELGALKIEFDFLCNILDNLSIRTNVSKYNADIIFTVAAADYEI